MSTEIWKQAEYLLPSSYVQQAADAARNRSNVLRTLLQHKKLPREGWDNYSIEMVLNQLSGMDSNNFPSNCGVGEREGRFASDIVARRHFYFGHGIGRSGDLMEIQPKAAGSSLISKLTNAMINDLLKLMGIHDQIYSVLVPVATSMSLVLSLLTLKARRPNAPYVIWSRIDQKACFKSITTAGFTPIVIDTVIEGDQLVTDMTEISSKIEELGPEQILCIMTTTSCFAPRACDNIESVAIVCQDNSIPHVINNAYGLQSARCMRMIQKAQRKGRVDIFVQSTDKNLMVPVGGTIIASFDGSLLSDISKNYPGRASSSPTIDAFITLLTLGTSGYENLVTKREQLFDNLNEKLIILAEKHGERILYTPGNPISIGLTLRTLKQEQLTKAGSMLFMKHVSGSRVITATEIKEVSNYKFIGWGAHCPNYPCPYLTCSASIGITEKDIDTFIKRLDKVLAKIRRSGGSEN